MSGSTATTMRLETLLLYDVNFFAYVKNNQHSKPFKKTNGERNKTDFLPMKVLSVELPP